VEEAMVGIKSVEDFNALVEEVEKRLGYRRPAAFGIGIASQKPKSGDLAYTYFPFPNYNKNFGTAAVFADMVGHLSGTATYPVTADLHDQLLRYFVPFDNDGKIHNNIIAIKSVLSQFENFIDEIGKGVVITFIDQPEFDLGAQTSSDACLRLQVARLGLIDGETINLRSALDLLCSN
jgi:Tetrahydrodipicolinate N-succinyltransferase N-terminal